MHWSLISRQVRHDGLCPLRRSLRTLLDCDDIIPVTSNTCLNKVYISFGVNLVENMQHHLYAIVIIMNIVFISTLLAHMNIRYCRPIVVIISDCIKASVLLTL